MSRCALVSSAVGLVTLLCLGVSAKAARADGPPPARFDVADLDGRPVDPLNGPGSVQVFVFVRTDCPISNRYAPTLRRLHDTFASRGVSFWMVYPDPDETTEAIRRHIADHDLPGPALRDPHHALVNRTGVRVTPESAVFSAGQMVYRGRIDDRVIDFGQVRPEPTTRDLERALEAVLAGRPVSTPTRPAVGCSIPALK